MTRRANTYIDNSTHTKQPERIDIHEHKAPTDESVRLLNEMQEKAMQNIVFKGEVKNNVFSGELSVFRLNKNITVSLDEVYSIYYKFKFNGQEYVINEQISIPHEEVVKVAWAVDGLQRMSQLITDEATKVFKEQFVQRIFEISKQSS